MSSVRGGMKCWVLALLCACATPPPQQALHEPPPRATASATSSPARDELALYRRFPGLRDRFPRAKIGNWPTPVRSLDELAAELGVESIVIKRDDLSAEPYGGSKPRKLELLLGAAIAAGKKTVVTTGGVGSHHALSTAIYAHALGLETHLLLMPQPPTAETRLVLLGCQQEGAQMELVGTSTAADRRAREIFDAAPDEVEIIPPGGSSPLGNLGFVSAGLELADQIEAGALKEPDVIFIAMGTMGSAIGLAIGLEAAGLGTSVVAVRAASAPSSQPHELQKMFDATISLLRSADPEFPKLALSERLRVDSSYLGAGYALPTPAGDKATLVAAKHGVELDPTYTAKAFAALLGAARGGEHRRLLFWQTHASPKLDPTGDPNALPHALRTYAQRER